LKLSINVGRGRSATSAVYCRKFRTRPRAKPKDHYIRSVKTCGAFGIRPPQLVVLSTNVVMRQRRPHRSSFVLSMEQKFQTENHPSLEPFLPRWVGAVQFTYLEKPKQGRAVAANSPFRWSHFAYAISWRTSLSVCASLISDGHRSKSGGSGGRDATEDHRHSALLARATLNFIDF
jgi:hypothetical protein